jgi:asparaginyl-tRNA synthetase
MERKEQVLFTGFVMEKTRNFFKMKGIPEVRYNQFSFAGSCENAPTTYWIDKKNEFLMLPQTRQIMAEEDLIRHGFEAVYTMQTSYRDEPRAGDGRHCNQFLLCEMEHLNLSQDKLIDFEEEMIRYMIQSSLHYFKKHRITTKQNIARLKYTLEVDFPRVTYTDVIKMLNERGVSINWGDDFRSRDEEFICGMFEEIPIPVAVLDYPERLKYFNMYEKRNGAQGTDRTVVECCDFLLPYAGETFGSSRREAEAKRIRKRFYSGMMYKQLKQRLMERKDIAAEDDAEKVITDAFEPYFKLFEHQLHERAGFGMGMGRMVQFLLGSTTIIEL